MNKEEFVEQYGEEAYEKRLNHSRKWKSEHQTEVQKTKHELKRKGGKYYEENLKCTRTGLQGARHKIRCKHGHRWRPYKAIIAPGSQIHHEWMQGTAEHRGVALVEADQHMRGFVDVIEILEGEIRLPTEAEVRGGMATW